VWREALLERAAVATLAAAGLRVVEAAVFLQVDRPALPAAVAELDQCIAEANSAYGVRHEVAARRDGPELVLVVDDESALAATVGEVLRLHGFAVIESTDPRRALDAARVHAVDLLLTDVVLPVMTGPQLVRRVVAQSPRTRPLFMSAYPVEEALAWDTPFLRKPLRFDTLAQAVRDALDRPPGRVPPAPLASR
jgi:CheY-like chemotaxis protein